MSSSSEKQATPAAGPQELLEFLYGLPTAAYACDVDGQITYFNEQAAELWGRTPELNDPQERFCGSWRLLASDQTPISHDQSCTAIALRERRVVDQAEAIVERPNGERRHVLARARPLFNAAGQLTGCVNVVVDMTDTLLAERSLRESEERYRLLADNISVMLWEGDAETLCFTYVSEFCEQLLGFPRDEWYQPGFWGQRIHPEDRHWVIEHCQRTTKALQDHRFEYRMIHADGRTVWVDDVVKVCVDQGRVIAMRGVLIDITERKLAEEELRRQKDKLEHLAAAAPAAICMYQRKPNGAGSFPYASRGIEFIYGLTAEALVDDASASWRLIHPDDVSKVRSSLDESARTMSLWDCEYRVRHPTRGEIWVAGRGVPQRRADDSVLWSGFLTDITTRKRLEAELQQSQRLEAIGRLAGGVAHDFNNLLTIINGNCHLLLANTDPTGQAELPRSELLAIRDAGARAAVLTRQLLAFARGQQARLVRLDVNVAIMAAKNLLAQLLGDQVELRLDLAPALGPVLADGGQLEQVLINLAVNARDAMPAGGRFAIRTEPARVSCGVESEDRQLPAGEYVRLSFCDTGLGMSHEVRSRIFDPFYTTKDSGERTGLGLAVVHGIVRHWGGGIDVASEVNSGATIRILLPVTTEPTDEPNHLES